MKEVLSRVEGLTNQPQTLYPGVRRNLFMAENQGEGVRLPEIPKTPTQPPQGEVGEPGTRWLEEHGIPPVAGGAEVLPLANFADPRAQNIVNEINRELERTGRKLPLAFIEGQIGRVRELLDRPDNPLNSNEGLGLLSDLNTWRGEIISELEKAQETRLGGRYFTPREEVAILTDENERERIFEEIFVGVDANPGVEYYQALSLEQRSKLDNFFTILSNARIFNEETKDITEDPEQVANVARERGKLTREFSGKSEVRRILHDANWSVSMGGGDIQHFAQAMATFQAEHIDLIFTDPLVGTAMHMFEQAFQQIKAENNGMLPYEKLAWNYKEKSSNLEDRVWELMREELKWGIIKNKSGPIPEWRLRRAIILARGFGVISLRFPELAAEARLPEEGPLTSAQLKAERYASIYGEAIARYLDPLEHLIEKFAIGKEDRALLYFFLTGEKARFQSKEQLQKALDMKSKLKGRDKRMIDIINIFRTGGLFSYSSWRAFTAMRGMSPEQLRHSGIGIREARVKGEVDDQIIAEVRQDPVYAGKSEEEIAKEVKRRAEKEVTIGDRNMEYKEFLVLQRRIQMWEDVQEVNPLRIMWAWENKEPGKRIEFLAQAIGECDDKQWLELSEEKKEYLREQAKKHLPQVEKDLIIIQEDAVLTLGLPKDDPNRIAFDGPEMLKYEIIGGPNPTEEELGRRRRVQVYVEKIREKARAGDNKFIRSLLEKTEAEGSPFPFIIGMEDIPFSDFNFINTGGRGLARRINDFAGAVQATNELTNLIVAIPTSHNIGPLVESLNKIKQAVSTYDRTIAKEVLPYLEEGLLRVYDKDVLARLPLGVGSVVGLLSDTSFAQKVYGREAMTWDETDKFNFTRQLLQKGLITKDEMKKLRKRVGATSINLAIDIFRTYGQLVLLFLVVEFMKRVLKEK